jgi:hypothetical protein
MCTVIFLTAYSSLSERECVWEPATICVVTCLNVHLMSLNKYNCTDGTAQNVPLFECVGICLSVHGVLPEGALEPT